MSKIEEIFRNSLKDVEAPYDAKAWEAMSKKLDKIMPVKAPKASFKYAWVASAVVLIGVAAYFALDKNQQPTIQTLKTNKTAEKKAEMVKLSETKEISVSKSLNVNQPKIAAKDNDRAIAINVAENDIVTSIPPRKKDLIDPTTYTLGAGISNGSAFILPKVNSKYCENDIVKIQNVNEQDFNLVSSTGQIITIKAKTSFNVDVKQGDYFFSHMTNGKARIENAFSVSAKAKADFYAGEEMIFYKGLPVTNLSANYAASKYTWTNEKGTILSNEKSFDAHFFTRGNHSITLQVQNESGCESSITKDIMCEATYNLLAMNSFIPTSTNSKVNTFMPYALLERNIPFTMVIIDPKTGQTIYETKNENEPWNGIDKRTQQLISPNTPFVWRVNLEISEIGESKNYQGTITRFED